MSTDEPRDPYADTTDWPITPPAPASVAASEVTTIRDGAGDGETTTPTGVVSPLSRPQPQPEPPARPSYVGPAAPRPWTSAPAAPTPPPGQGPGAGNGRTHQPAYPPPQRTHPPEQPPHPGVQPAYPTAKIAYPSRPPTYPQPGYPPSQGLSEPWGHGVRASKVDFTRHVDNRKWYLIGGAAAVAIAVVVSVVLLTRGGGDTTASPAATTTAAPSLVPVQPPATTTTAAPISVDPSSLPQLLLPADAISTALSSPGMVAAPVKRINDPGSEPVTTPLDCASTWAPGLSWTYQISGDVGMARQNVTEQPTPNHAVSQAVVAFPDAAGAKKSYATQVKTWNQCANQTVTAHLSGAPKDQTAVMGTVTEADGMATLPLTPDIGLPGVLCERALTVVGNVVVDVRSCSPNVGDTAATLARAIAAKINGR